MVERWKKLYYTWRYLGYDPNELNKYETTMALSNLTLVENYCEFIIPFVCIATFFTIFFFRPSHPLLATVLVLFIIFATYMSISIKRYLKQNNPPSIIQQSIIKANMFKCMTLVLVIIYEFSILEDETFTMLLICLLVNQIVFDSFPLHNISVSFVYYIVSIIFMNFIPGKVLDAEAVFLLILTFAMGQIVSWTKTKGKFALLINSAMQKKLQEDNMQIKMMTSQIRPHFVYNTMTTISALIKKQPSVAYDTSVLFASYLRSNIDAISDTSCIPFKEELKHLQTYYSLEKIRFGNKVAIEYLIETQDFSLPPLTVEPLIENAIKHGVNQKRGVVHITVSTYEKENQVIIVVKDDGPGFVVGEEINDGRDHAGLQNVTKRLALMKNASLKVESIVGEGTTVTIVIPKEDDVNEDSRYRR